MATHRTVFQRLVRADSQEKPLRLSADEVHAVVEMRDQSIPGQAYADDRKRKQARCTHEWSMWFTHLWNYPMAGRADLQTRECRRCRLHEARRQPEGSPW